MLRNAATYSNNNPLLLLNCKVHTNRISFLSYLLLSSHSVDFLILSVKPGMCSSCQSECIHHTCKLPAGTCSGSSVRAEAGVYLCNILDKKSLSAFATITLVKVSNKKNWHFCKRFTFGLTYNFSEVEPLLSVSQSISKSIVLLSFTAVLQYAKSYL